MSDKIGFIGLGIMGAPMSRNLAKKFPGILCYDIDPERARLAAAVPGVAAASNIEEIGRTCNTVFLSLPTTAAVKSVVLGPGGLLGTMKAGGIVIDTSTTDAAVEIEIAGALKAEGLGFLDAPVSGGEKGAVEGSLAFMVGGEKPAFEACKKYLAAMGGSVVHMGGVSLGQTTKYVNQMIVGATFAVIAEGFALGTKAGLDPKVLYDAIKGGWAASKLLDVAAADMFSREFKPGGTIDIHWKDLGYVLSLARDKDIPTPMTALTHELFKAARAAGDGKKSHPVLVRLWERLLNVEVK
jgi:2-hydroxy-3-oxopropionate reductase